MNKDKLIYISKKIKKIGKEIFNTLGSGFNETIYQNCLTLEFRDNNIHYLKEVNIEIFYKGESVGVDRPDFILTKIGRTKEPVVLETKVTDNLTDNDKMQLKSYYTSLPLNDHPVLKEFAGGILMAFPKRDLTDEAEVKVFVVDEKFNVVIEE